MRVEVYIHQDDGTYLAHVPAVFGVVGGGKSREGAVRSAVERARAVAAERRARGEPAPDAVEDHAVRDTTGVTVPEDFARLTAEEMRHCFHWLERSRERLLALVRDLSPDVLERQPRGPGYLASVADVLHHVSVADWFYITRLRAWPAEPLARHEAVQAWGLDALAALGERDRVSFNYWEEWTPRRALRQGLEREARLREALAERRAALGLPAIAVPYPAVRLGFPLDVVNLRKPWNGPLAAHVAALPGCAAAGATREEALAKLPDARRAALAYLGERDPELAEPRVADVEEGALFESDRLPLADADLAAFRHALDDCRSAVRRLVEGIATTDLAPTDAREGGPPTAGRAIEQAALEEWYYFRSALHDWPREPFARLAAIRAWALARLRALTDEEQRRETTFLGERWTARKVFRRMLEHEMEHGWHIEELLADARAAGA